MDLLKKLQLHLETEYKNIDVIPAGVGGKIPRYPHKDGVWTHEKAREHISECVDGAILLLSDELVVIDVDDLDMCNDLEGKMPEFKETVCTRTKKGKHYYFRTTPEFKFTDKSRGLLERNRKRIPIDIKTVTSKGTRGCISIPPSPGKTWIKSLLENRPLVVPQAFINFKIEHEEVNSLVNMLSSERADNEPEWKQVGWALKNMSEDYLENWIEFSKKSPKFTPGECEALWSKFSKENSGLGKGSIYMWAKQDSLDLKFIYNSSQTLPYVLVKNIFEKSVYLVTNPSLQFIEIQPDGSTLIRTKGQLIDVYDDIVCLDSEGHKKRFIRMWIQDKSRARYRSLDFLPPPQHVKEDVFNMWKGFEIDKHQVSASADVGPFKYHVSLLCGHNPEMTPI